MQCFSQDLLKKHIIMLSDYVVPETYSKRDARDENSFISKIEQEVKRYKVDFEYVELKNIRELKKTLSKLDKKETIIFNWYESVNGKGNMGYLVTKVLDEKGFIYTGADTGCLKLTSNKLNTKKVLIKNGIITPDFHLLSSGTNFNNQDLLYPIILKLYDRHSSESITNKSVIEDRSQLKHQAKKLIKMYKTKLLAEEYIDGQEFTVPVWGNNKEVSIMPIYKVHFSNNSINKIFTKKAKENCYSKAAGNTEVSLENFNNSPKLLASIKNAVTNAYRCLEFKDYGRFDLRVRNGIAYVMDANPNPLLGSYYTFSRSAKHLGYNCGETILQICEFALKRNM